MELTIDFLLQKFTAVENPKSAFLSKDKTKCFFNILVRRLWLGLDLWRGLGWFVTRA